MAFKFSLQGVLDHRSAVEDVRRRAHAEIRREIEALRVERARLSERIDDCRDGIGADLLRGVDNRRLQLLSSCLGWADAGVRQIDRSIAARREEIEKRRLALAEAVKRRRILEVLRDKEAAEHRRAMARLEQKAYDEFALREFAMHRREEKNSGAAERMA
jgi:flagellar export protein FliJ